MWWNSHLRTYQKGWREFFEKWLKDNLKCIWLHYLIQKVNQPREPSACFCCCQFRLIYMNRERESRKQIATIISIKRCSLAQKKKLANFRYNHEIQCKITLNISVLWWSVRSFANNEKPKKNNKVEKRRNKRKEKEKQKHQQQKWQ